MDCWSLFQSVDTFQYPTCVTRCPFISNQSEPDVPYYRDYLSLKTILNSQHPVSETKGELVHDEMFFIIMHQAHELWFKQIIFEIDSVREIFKSEKVDEKLTLRIVQRLNRVLMILKLVTEQIPILETMTAQDFLAFRDYLYPASGFQSCQFRELEMKLGIKAKDRLGRSDAKLREALKQEERDILVETESEPSLSQLIQNWLERTPGLEEDNFSFYDAYKEAVKNKIEFDKKQIETETNGNLNNVMLDVIKQSVETFEDILNIEGYNQLFNSGQRKMTHKSFMGALMINVYRDLPRFSQPFQILTLLVDIDNQLTKWRYAHCLMVQRMIGSRIGTGSSSGYQYLRSTISDHYKVFTEIAGMSTYLIPANFLPSLPEDLKKRIAVPQ
ncbi:Tryptophan 2,3-dioxygenase-like [Oopsacas minuta]|uniref:Tryptophan 2,3-dioxygenase n=1 Tax=Oopsacas minuta TaxID=111878 RepID=A0AAV7JN02_9METZ|nr:Tryptophan 2,3-dioxygenase-like [Oopsacas minuta]